MFDCVEDMMDLVLVRFVLGRKIRMEKIRWQFIVLRWEVCNVVRTFASMFFFGGLTLGSVCVSYRVSSSAFA